MSIQLDAKEMLARALRAVMGGHDKIHTAAFRNEDKQEGDNRPVFHSKSVAIWRAQKQAKNQQPQEEKV